MTALAAAQGLLLYLLLGWKLAHLARAPRNVPLRCVVACLAFAAVGFTAQLPVVSLVSPASRWMVLTQFSLVLATSCALDCFFLFSLLGRDDARRRAVRRAVAVTAVVILMTVAVALAAPGASIRDHSVPTVAVFYLLFMAANGFLLADALRWTRQGTAGSEPVLARGLRLTSAGLALMIAALVPLTAMVVLRWARLPAPTALLTTGVLIAVPGIVVFLAGVGYPGAVMRLSAVRVYARHYRLYRQLSPLWTALHQLFPQDTLARVPAAGWRETLNPWHVHRRCYRRVIEIRDGLVRLSPYLSPPSGSDPATLGERLITTLQTVHTDALVPRQAQPVAVPESGGLDADADELARLSRQMATAREEPRG